VPQHGGPAALREGDAADVRLPADLRAALHEWTEVADVVLRSGDVHELDLLRRRGRQLASRVAHVLGRPVEFVDPVSGAVEPIGARAARNGAAVPGHAAGSWHGHDGTAAAGGAVHAVTGADPAADPAAEDRAGQAPAPDGAGPTPWGPGTAVAAFFAVLVAVADIVLARAFAGAFGLLWVPANLLVTAGTLPSLWLARDVPFWRWPVLGVAAGLAAAWVVLLLGLLG
jgi:hypothetical protein